MSASPMRAFDPRAVGALEWGPVRDVLAPRLPGALKRTKETVLDPTRVTDEAA